MKKQGKEKYKIQGSDYLQAGKGKEGGSGGEG